MDSLRGEQRDEVISTVQLHSLLEVGVHVRIRPQHISGVNLIVFIAGAVLSPFVIVEGSGIIEHTNPLFGHVGASLQRQCVLVKANI